MKHELTDRWYGYWRCSCGFLVDLPDARRAAQLYDQHLDEMFDLDDLSERLCARLGHRQQKIITFGDWHSGPVLEGCACGEWPAVPAEFAYPEMFEYDERGNVRAKELVV